MVARFANTKLLQRKAQIGSLLLLFVGVMILFFHQPIQDCLYGVFCVEGCYIPDRTFQLPPRTGITIATHSFRVYNMHSKPIILTAQPTCKCTTLSWRSKHVAAFSWQDINVGITYDGSERGHERAIIFTTSANKQPYLFAYLDD